MDDINMEKMQNERDVLNNRACQFAYDGNYDDSIKIFNELLATDPNDFRTLSNIATVVGKSGRYDESLDLFGQLVSRAPGILSNRICYINLLTYCGKYERALECYRQMPRPGVIESMMLGSLSDDFKKLQTIHRKKDTEEDTAKKMGKSRSKMRAGKSSEKSPQFISLIWAGPLPF